MDYKTGIPETGVLYRPEVSHQEENQ